MQKKKVTLSLNSKVYSDFQKICNENAFVFSKKIELMIQEFLKNKKRILSLLFMFFFGLFFIASVSATDIAFDGFECNGFNCGLGWGSAWSYSGICEMETLNARGSYHMKGFSGCDAARNFNNENYAQSNISFWATAGSLESGEYCRYYYYNGISYIEVLSLTDGDDDNTHDYYEFDVTQYGLSSNAQVRMYGSLSTGDYCYIDDINITGYGTSDSTSPTFSDYQEIPVNGSTYSQGQFYEFNITITEENLDMVGIEFNGINYTILDLRNVSNIYIFNRTDLAAGDYSYYWWANDTNGNYNTSGVRSYVINKITSSTTLTFSSASPQTYGGAINASCSTDNLEGTSKLHRNGVDVTSTENNQNIVLAAGTHNYVCNVTETQNYSYASSGDSFIINKASGDITLLLNSQASDIVIQYPQESNMSASTSYGSVTIYRDGIDITSENGLNVTRAGNYYNITAVSSGNQNYSSAIITRWLNITKAVPTCSLTIFPSTTIIYPAGVNITGSCTNNEASDTLYRDGINITGEKGLNVTLAAGTYQYKINITETQNYTSAESVESLVVNKASTTTTLTVTPNSPITYGTESNFSCSNSANLPTILYINGGDRSSEKDLDILRAAGTYTVNCTSLDNQNYTGDSQQISYTINKATPAASLTNTGAWAITYGTSATIGYSESNPGDADVSYKVYRDNVDKGSGETIVLGVENYNYVLNTTGGQNYTSISILDSNTLTINKASPSENLQISINPSSNENYGTPTQATATESNIGDSDLIYKFYRVSTLIASSSPWKELVPQTLNAGTYLYIFNTTGGQNYTAGNITTTLIINKIENSVDLLINGFAQNLTIQYPQQVNASAISDSGVVSLYRNGVDVTSENSQNVALGVGYYEYLVNSSGNQNYFANSTGIKFYVNVTEAPDVIGPTITIVLPEAITYSQNTSLSLNFSVSDPSGVDSCWYSIDGGDNISLPDCANTTFDVSGGATYILIIYANDTRGLQSNNSVSFNVDVTGISSSISEPTGTKTSRTGIALTYIATGNNLSCWYNVKTSIGGSVIGNTTLTNCSNSSFGVSADGDYILTLFVNNTLGTSNSTNSSFSVDTSTSTPAPAPAPSGGGSSGGGGGVIISRASVARLEIEEVNVVSSVGEDKNLLVNVKNVGGVSANKCRLVVGEGYERYIDSSDLFNIGAGEIVEFMFVLSVLDVDVGGLDLRVGCLDNISVEVPLNIVIWRPDLDVSIVEISFDSDGKLLVAYNIEPTDSSTRSLFFRVLNSEGGIVAEVSEDVELVFGQIYNGKVLIDLSDVPEGMLKVAITDENKVSFVEEDFVYGGGLGITGFSLFNLDSDSSYIGIILIVFLVLVVLLVIRIWKLKKKVKEK